MKNSKNIILILIGVLVIAGGIAAFALRKEVPKPAQTANTNSPAQESSVDATKSDAQKFLEQYKGEDFDRIFLANMIAHHSGAIDMANLALTNAKHKELKNMAREIVSAQTKEINQMKSWQQAWGYPPTSGEMMEDHSAMGMTSDMDNATKQLQGKTGDEFDNTFLSLMIEHHESAVGMSRPAAQNAGHQEIKDLARAIIEAQDAEIAQMRAWQVEWGYDIR